MVEQSPKTPNKTGKPALSYAQQIKEKRKKQSNIKRRKDGTIQQLPVSMNLNDPEEMRKKMGEKEETDHAALQEDLIARTKTAIKAL